MGIFALKSGGSKPETARWFYKRKTWYIVLKQNLIMEKMIKHIHCPTDGNTIIFILVSILSTFHTYGDLVI